MRRFQLHVHDDRSGKPQIYFVEVRDAARARALALQRLDASPHHARVAIMDGGELVETIERGAPEARLDG